MEYLLIIIFIVILSMIAGKSLYNMPNPGSRFYDSINNNDKKKKK